MWQHTTRKYFKLIFNDKRLFFVCYNKKYLKGRKSISKDFYSSVTGYTHSMVSLLTLSNVSRFARSNSSWYLSIRSAFSQSLTVATDDKSVGVGLSSGWEQLLYKGGNVKIEHVYKNSRLLITCCIWYVLYKCLPEAAVSPSWFCLEGGRVPDESIQGWQESVEAWPVPSVCLPALKHQRVEGRGAVGGGRETVLVCYGFHHLQRESERQK